MAIKYSFVLPPFGGAQNHIVREMFDDITKYFATVDALYLKLTGGTMSGAIAMGSHKITGLADGSAATDAVAFDQIKILQTVTASITSNTTTSSTTFVDSALSVAITPTSSSSRILIIVTGWGSQDVTNKGVQWTISRGTTNLGATDGLLAFLSSAGTAQVAVAMTIVDSPATTSATTYKVRLKASTGGTAEFGLSSVTSVIVAMEIV